MNITNQLINEFSEQLRAKLILQSEHLNRDAFTIDEIIEAVKLTASRMNDRDLASNIGIHDAPFKDPTNYPLL